LGYLCNCPTSLSAYKCDCAPTHYYKDSVSGCVSRSTQSQACSFTYQCLQGLGLSCSGSTCNCGSSLDYYWNGASCQETKTIYFSCSFTFECKTGLGLQCLSNICSCPTGQYWDRWYSTTPQCVSQFAYGTTCLVDKQCSSALNLVCSQADFLSVSACPNLHTAHHCDCAKTKYYAGSTLGCVTRIQYGSSCTDRYRQKIKIRRGERRGELTKLFIEWVH
jgi:hypothetical protein